MTHDEEELVRRYIAGSLDPRMTDVAELLILVDVEAAGLLKEWLDARDRKPRLPSATS